MAPKAHPSVLRSCIRPPRLYAFPNLITTPRTYHSHTLPPPPAPFAPARCSILSASTRHIPSYGFTSQTLALGAKDAGFIDASTNLFSDGPFSLVLWHLYTQRNRLSEISERLLGSGGAEGRESRTGSRVKILMWERLLGNAQTGVVGRWQEALALSIQPSNIAPMVRELSLLSDEIWYLAGDVSVDTSWYSKRLSLASIYASTELFMTTDGSEDYAETRSFMERRFRDVQSVGETVGSVSEWLGFTARAGLNVLRSKGVRI